MENLSPETKSIYEFLKLDIADTLDKRFKEQDTSMRNIFSDLTNRIQEVKTTLGIDLDEIRSTLD